MLSILKIHQENIDCDILVKIENEKIEFFTNIFNKISLLEESNEERIIFKKYLNLYVNSDLFDEGIQLIKNIFISFDSFLPMYDLFIDNKIEFWKTLIDHSKDSEISEDMYYNLFKKLYTFNNFKYIGDYVLINKFLLKKIVYCEINAIENLKSIGLEFNWGRNFWCQNNIISSNITYNLILSSLKNKKSRNITIEILQDLVNEFKIFKNFPSLLEINESEFNISKIDNKVSVYLTYIFLKLWNDGITNEKLIKIDYEYLESHQCKLEWIEKKNNNIKKYNFLTEMFFIIQKLLETSFVNLHEELNQRKHEDKELDKLVDLIEGKLSNPTVNHYQELILNESKLKVSGKKIICLDRIKFLKNILNDLHYEKLIEDFYNMTSIWLLNLDNVKINCIDNLLQNLITFSLNPNTRISYNVFDLLVMLINKNKITNNPHQKTDSLKILIKLSEKEYFADYIYLESTKKLLVNNLINCMIFLNDSFSNGDIYDKYGPQFNISFLLRIILFNDLRNDPNSLDYFILKDEKRLKKFINIIINNLSHCIQELFLNIKKIFGLETKENPNEEEISKLEDSVKAYLVFTHDFLKLNTIFSYVYYKEYLSIENRGTICGSICHILDSMLGNKKNELNIKNKDKLYFKPKNLLFKICKLLLNFVNEDIFLDTLVKESSKDVSKLTAKMMKILYLKSDFSDNMISSLEYNKIQIFIDNIKNRYEKEIDYDDIEIPEEFCDPIMMTLIEDPVFLPNTNMVVEREVISRHLVTEEHNPFNREHLTIDMLKEYNMKEEILKKKIEFTKKRDEWKTTI